MNRRLVVLVPGLVFGLVGSAPAQVPAKAGSAFRLPKGDAARGKTAFQDLKCHACHAVAGFPAPVAQPPVPMILGGPGRRGLTDTEILTAIVDPSHYVVPAGPEGATRSGSLSRMGDFSEAMTVRQLLDLVTFVQSLHDTSKAGR